MAWWERGCCKVNSYWSVGSKPFSLGWGLKINVIRYVASSKLACRPVYRPCKWARCRLLQFSLMSDVTGFLDATIRTEQSASRHSLAYPLWSLGSYIQLSPHFFNGILHKLFKEFNVVTCGYHLIGLRHQEADTE